MVDTPQPLTSREQRRQWDQQVADRGTRRTLPDPGANPYGVNRRTRRSKAFKRLLAEKAARMAEGLD